MAIHVVSSFCSSLLPLYVSLEWNQGRITTMYHPALHTRCHRAYQEGLDIRVRFKLHTTLRKLLTRPKDPIPMFQWASIVYEIPCDDCTKAYIGQSSRTLLCRVKEHKWAVQNGDTYTSALAEHAWEVSHHIDWSSVEVLDSEQFLFSRLLLEFWYIHREPYPINRDRGPLPTEYCCLID